MGVRGARRYSDTDGLEIAGVSSSRPFSVSRVLSANSFADPFHLYRNAIVDALKSGQLAGYAGDVWFPQPAPKDHPWRTMPHQAMTPHISGTSLSAQARYVAGMFSRVPDTAGLEAEGRGLCVSLWISSTLDVFLS